MSLAISGSQCRKTPGRVHHGVFLFWAFISVSSIIGCSAGDAYLKRSPDAPVPASNYIQGVPFFPQEDFQCGPSVLASVFNYYGYEILPEEVTAAIYSHRLKGTLKMDMVMLARRYEKDGGFRVSEIEGDMAMIRRDLAAGYPVIVFADLGIWKVRRGHYMLIVGYDDRRNGLIVYSGAEKDRLISYSRFMKMWKRGGYWTLRITRE